MKKNELLYNAKNRLVEENEKLKEQNRELSKIRKNQCE